MTQSFKKLRRIKKTYDADEISRLMGSADQERVTKLADALSEYISTQVLSTIDRRNSIADYRANPYVFMTSSNLMDLSTTDKISQFLFNTKMYMGLETSFGKSMESIVVGEFPQGAQERWSDAPEKLAEFAQMQAESAGDRDKYTQLRNKSVWREIDRAVTVGDRRYLVTIKSGPQCINDTQVQGMFSAIRDNATTWLEASSQDSRVKGIDIVIGITYGTDSTTNNKENNILRKMLEAGLGFREVDPINSPGLLSNNDGSIRIYRVIGDDFWSFIGSPDDLTKGRSTLPEVLLALSLALSNVKKNDGLRQALKAKTEVLETALKAKLALKRAEIPQNISAQLDDGELYSLAVALTSYYDEGI